MTRSAIGACFRPASTSARKPGGDTRSSSWRSCSGRVTALRSCQLGSANSASLIPDQPGRRRQGLPPGSSAGGSPCSANDAMAGETICSFTRSPIIAHRPKAPSAPRFPLNADVGRSGRCPGRVGSCRKACPTLESLSGTSRKWRLSRVTSAHRSKADACGLPPVVIRCRRVRFSRLTWFRTDSIPAIFLASPSSWGRFRMPATIVARARRLAARKCRHLATSSYWPGSCVRSTVISFSGPLAVILSASSVMSAESHCLHRHRFPKRTFASAMSSNLTTGTLESPP